MRILVAVVFFIPSLPFVYLVISIFGIGFIIPISVFIIYVFGWLTSNKELIKDAKDGLDLFIEMLVFPFEMWYNFVLGRKSII